MDKYYLTKERLEELKVELEGLKNGKRQEVAEKLKHSKEYGDLSENSEYAEAREEQAVVESRIFELDDLLKKAVIIKKSESGDKIAVGSLVTVKKGEKIFEYSLVGSYEAKPEEGKISDESPLGRAFLGKKVGDDVTVKTPAGEATYQITKIE
ncbi:MAG: transcription elongation factor GreA [Patescibacteria group bacterium]|nr:transcription elongation factor GreA [Patescibacteria group bacterium]MDE2015578.1 transcription elongation factor GreA [Patescibacteria group bacterium]MDE2227226.1 transcription elongation factor GreA [Patescibacteria group bacterium]